MKNKTKTRISPLEKIYEKLCGKSSKKASFLIPTCGIIVVVAALLSVTLLFAQTIASINHQKDATRQKLDDYLAICAIDEFNALKQGAGYGEVMSRDDIVANAYDELDFGENAVNINIQFVEADGVRLQVTYDLTVKILAETQITVPITVTGKFIRK